MNFFIILQGEIQGIRQGQWKLLIKNKRSKGKNETEKFLFNLKFDLGEKNNLYENNREIVNKLSKRMIQLDNEIEKNARSPLASKLANKLFRRIFIILKWREIFLLS